MTKDTLPRISDQALWNAEFDRAYREPRDKEHDRRRHFRDWLRKVLRPLFRPLYEGDRSQVDPPAWTGSELDGGAWIGTVGTVGARVEAQCCSHREVTVTRRGGVFPCVLCWIEWKRALAQAVVNAAADPTQLPSHPWGKGAPPPPKDEADRKGRAQHRTTLEHIRKCVVACRQAIATLAKLEVSLATNDLVGTAVHMMRATIDLEFAGVGVYGHCLPVGFAALVTPFKSRKKSRTRSSDASSSRDIRHKSILEDFDRMRADKKCSSLSDSEIARRVAGRHVSPKTGKPFTQQGILKIRRNRAREDSGN